MVHDQIAHRRDDHPAFGGWDRRAGIGLVIREHLRQIGDQRALQGANVVFVVGQLRIFAQHFKGADNKLPQAFGNMEPVLLTQTIILFQDTSLVYAIGAYDLLKGFEIAGKNFNRPVETYLVAAVLYFVISFSLSMLVKKLQQRIAIIR